MEKRIDVTAGADGQGNDGADNIQAGGEDAGEETGTEGAEGAEELVDDEQHDDAKGEKLPEKIQKMLDKRIGKEVGKRKTAEERATLAETELKELRGRVDADDAEIALTAARDLGVLPEVIGKGQAEGMINLRKAKTNVKYLERALEDAEGDEITIGGNVYTKKQVKESLRGYRDDVENLEPKYGGLEHEAKKKMLAIMRLGQQAERAGWKPGQKPAEAVKPSTDVKPAPKKIADDEQPARVRRRDEADVGRDEKPGESLESFFDRQEKDKAKARH